MLSKPRPLFYATETHHAARLLYPLRLIAPIGRDFAPDEVAQLFYS